MLGAGGKRRGEGENGRREWEEKVRDGEEMGSRRGGDGEEMGSRRGGGNKDENVVYNVEKRKYCQD